MAEIAHLRRPDMPETSRERAKRLMQEAEDAAGDALVEAMRSFEAAANQATEALQLKGGHVGLRELLEKMVRASEVQIAAWRSIEARR